MPLQYLGRKKRAQFQGGLPRGGFSEAELTLLNHFFYFQQKPGDHPSLTQGATRDSIRRMTASSLTVTPPLGRGSLISSIPGVTTTILDQLPEIPKGSCGILDTEKDLILYQERFTRLRSRSPDQLCSLLSRLATFDRWDQFSIGQTVVLTKGAPAPYPTPAGIKGTITDKKLFPTMHRAYIDVQWHGLSTSVRYFELSKLSLPTSPTTLIFENLASNLAYEPIPVEEDRKDEEEAPESTQG